MAGILADLPSLRQVEISPRHMPVDKRDYASQEWMGLMSTLSGNGGCLKIVSVECEKGDWFEDWSLIGGRNFAWWERVMLRTAVSVRSWEELVEGDWGNFEFSSVLLRAMRENWRCGPLKQAVVRDADKDGHEVRRWNVKFWGVPEDVRRGEEVRERRREGKKAFEEARRAEMKKKKKNGRGSPRLVLEDGFDSEEGEGVEGIEGRRREVITREEARMRRMERQGRMK